MNDKYIIREDYHEDIKLTKIETPQKQAQTDMSKREKICLTKPKDLPIRYEDAFPPIDYQKLKEDTSFKSINYEKYITELKQYEKDMKSIKGILIFFGILFLISLISTIYDIFLGYDINMSLIGNFSAFFGLSFKYGIILLIIHLLNKNKR